MKGARVALDETLRRLLDDVTSRRVPGLRHLAAAPDPGAAAEADLDEVCQALTDEMVETGFTLAGVLNERGLLLGQVLDELNRSRLRRPRR